MKVCISLYQKHCCSRIIYRGF